MEKISILRYPLSLAFFIFCFVTTAAEQISSFSLKKFETNPIFGSQVALFGDAEVVNGGYSVNVTRSSILSAGRLMYKQPIKLVEGNPRKGVSFSTYFSFSISPDNGDGIAFVLLPSGFPSQFLDGTSFGLSPGLGKLGSRVLAVEFDTSMDAKFADPNGNHVGIDIDTLVSVAVSNVTSLGLVLNGGDKLHTWIDYDASSKYLQVRLGKLGNVRPSDPLISYPIDLSEMWKEEEVFVGLSSSTGNSSQTTTVHSWSFTLRRIPNWMHSQPLDPRAHSEPSKPLTVTVVHKKKDCVIRTLTGVIFGTACGALVTLIVMALWNFFTSRPPVAPVEYPEHPVELGYEKIRIIREKATTDDKK
ncbi:PREDICTED: L-type lectin-domain containing receptor kinase VIII.2 [Nelumbo nucifera]|uniref:Legume lectin domain-containing protein n=2 Tax=Nelumbo nucifera TaxID=4432 RepID=A0A822Y1V8_NELNU|nr:PREDICTED: L-type lectin-domain containing receptor kinase VIII.2 [Nelumbo nucifera]DAD26600.1 TPA_asm: hypothetical protein HUJ06_028068 [Nelumbo nucifera]